MCFVRPYRRYIPWCPAASVPDSRSSPLCVREGWSLRLRRRLLYEKECLYVVVALVNLVLRFMWTITLMPENGLSDGDGFFGRDMQVHLSPFVAAAEIIRRCGSCAGPCGGHTSRGSRGETKVHRFGESLQFRARGKKSPHILPSPSPE